MTPDNTMTRWDHFAAAALAGVAGNPSSGCNSPRDLAHWAASVADSLVLERVARSGNYPQNSSPDLA